MRNLGALLAVMAVLAILEAAAPFHRDGNVLSVFDRLFRTFTPTGGAAQVEYGPDGYDGAEANRLGRLLVLPFVGK